MAASSNSVTLSTDFNVDPYYDDFDESKNFHRILFRPGLAVQARELTQMQTILQNQIDRFAEHMFKEGSTVRGMDMSYDMLYHYVKLRDYTSTGGIVSISSFANNTIIKGQTSGVVATVINTRDGSEANTPHYKTLYVKYLSANTTTGYRYFANNEIIQDPLTGTLSCNTITVAMGGATGHGIAAKFDTGVIYAKDHFIRVAPQTVIISKYDPYGSARVGYDVAESVITEISDDTLLDPASGSYNYAAPGAARLKLEATIKSVGLTATVANTFVELMQVKDGIVQSVTTKPQYAQIRNYMAQRTFDESGDYTVSGLNVSIKEHLLSGNNQGAFTGGDSSLLYASLSPGKAYVKGYDIELVASRGVSIQKGVEYNPVQSAKALADYGNYIVVENLVGNWDVNQQAVVSLRDTRGNTVIAKTYSSTNFAGNEIGRARVRAVEYFSGTPGTASCQYKMYITDVTMNSGKSFTQVQSLGFNGGTGTVYGKADLRKSNGYNANTADPKFERAVVRLPAEAVRRLRNLAGSVNNDFEFYKAYDVSFLASGIGTLNSSDAAETFDGSGTLSDSATRSDFIVICRGTSSGGYGNTANFSTITLTTSSGSNSVTASASVDNVINPGDIINIHTGGGNFVVSSVSGSTITIFGTATATGGSKAFCKSFAPGQILDFGGYGKSGDRSISISSGTTATLTLNEGTLGSALNTTVIAKVNKIDGQEATKAVVRNRLVQIRVGAGGGTSYTANTTGPYPLGLADGFKLVSVRKKSGSNFSTTTDGSDVTSHFTLDSGMLDNYYSHARIVKRPASGLVISSGDRLLVTLDHFTHANRERGYFSVDSYPVSDSTAATDTSKIFTHEIPIFVSPISGGAYDLRDCVDFRPRLSDTANSVSALTNISINPKISNTFVTASGGIHFPTVGSDFTTDLEYYLRRIDILNLNQDGAIQVTRGISAVRPVAPNIPADSMALGTIYITPYPSLPSVLARRYGRPDYAVTLRKMNNRRFTMKDIGMLSDRVDRLINYTSLSLLEKNAADLKVLDSQGNDRFKNGILVDNFNSHGVGNVFDPDYKIAVDQYKGEMRPRFTLNETPLQFTANSMYVVRTNVTPAGVSRDQKIVLTTSPVASYFKPGSTVTSGGRTATIRHRIGTILYVEEATGTFTAASAIISNDGGSATISSVVSNTPGSLVTLPYKHKPVVIQPFASTTRNCVGTAYTWRGTLTLTPDNDYWCETTKTTPDIDISIDLNTDGWNYLISNMPAHYNAPITTFVGEPVAGEKTTIFGETIATPNADGSTTLTQNTRDMTQYSQATSSTSSGFQFKSTVINSAKQQYGNVMRSTELIQSMRSRMILFKGIGLKPSSRLWGFFDNISVQKYITPLTAAEYNAGLKSITGAPVIPAAAETAPLYTTADGEVYGVFRLPNDGSVKFNVGTKRLRLVDNQTNSSTFGQYTTACEAQYSAEGLINDIAALTVSTKSVEISQSSLSSTTTGSVQYNTQTATGSRLIGNLPPPTEITHYVPQVEFVPTFIPIPVPVPVYNPIAYVPSFIPSIVPSIVPGPVQTVLVPTTVIEYVPVDRPVPADSFNGGDDPIAQTMFISAKLSRRINTSGVYLTKIDLFFSTKDAKLPVTVELREVDQLSGNITPRVVPYSRAILQPSEVNISDNGVSPTPVYFPSPIYLPDESEYAIVIIPAAVNPNYNVHVAELGEKDYSNPAGESITSCPAAGFMFTSSNQRLWVPVEKEDLKFTAYFAEFDNSQFGVTILKNPPREFITIANTTGPFDRIGDTVEGETRVVGSFSIATGSPSNTAAIATHIANNSAYAQGITSGATGKIVAYSSNSLRIRDVSTTVKFIGGEKIRIRIANTTTRNGTDGEIKGSGTTTSVTYPIGRIALYDNVNSSNTKLILANVSFISSGASAFANAKYFKVDTYIKSQTNAYTGRIVTIENPRIDNFNVITNMIIPSNNAVKAYAKMATSMSTRDSNFFRVNLNSDNPVTSSRYILSHSTESNTSASSANMGRDKSLELAFLYENQNIAASPAIDLERVAVYHTNNLISTESEVGTSEENVKFGGISEARYISRTVTLADNMDAEDIRVYLTAYKPSGSNLLVYYKIMHSDDADGMNEKKWIPMTLNEGQGFTTTYRYSSSENSEDFIELVYDTPYWSDTYKAGANNSTGIIEYQSNSKARFSGYKYFAIKIVPVSPSGANPPRVKDLRAIATMSRI
jgi:hypothetical protein